MHGKIPEQFIDDLVARADIVDVVNQRVPLKRAGSEYKACCPFHDEKTPSFTVSPSKQFYHCFGCGAHGTALGFLMEYDRLTFPEAIEALAENLGLDVPREAGTTDQPNHALLYTTLATATDYYERQLHGHSDAKRAIDYLQARGVSGDVATNFRMGYAPPGWDNLLRRLGKDREAMSRLNRCGLISEHEQRGAYDRLRDRIVFPIRDTRGRTIGFGGRLLGNGTPKYLNSPETELFHKGRELYGLYEAKQANKQLERLLVVEGYLDVIALAQFGISHAVATLGTATTTDHLDKLFRSVPEIVFCFDGDRAGREAAWKALQAALPFMRDGRQARFLFLPEGEDPDSLIRGEGADAFVTRTDRAEPLSGYLFRHLQQGLNLDIPEGQASLVERAKPHIERIPAGVFRELLASQLEKLVPAGHVTSRRQINATRRRYAPDSYRPRTLMQQAIALLLQNPAAVGAATLPAGIDVAQGPGIDLLMDLLESLHETPNLSTGRLIDRFAADPKTYRTLTKLAAAALDIPPEVDIGEQFSATLLRVVDQARKNELAMLSNKPLAALSADEKQRLRELLTQQADE